MNEQQKKAAIKSNKKIKFKLADQKRGMGRWKGNESACHADDLRGDNRKTDNPNQFCSILFFCSVHIDSTEMILH